MAVLFIPQNLRIENPACTIVMATRERFSLTETVLDAVERTVPASWPVVLVAGGMPGRLAARLRTRFHERGWILVEPPCLLSQHESYHAGLVHVRTPWVIFMDNDVLPGEGWAERLVAAAEASGAGFQKWFQKRIFVPVESAVCVWVARREERSRRKYLHTVPRLRPVNASGSTRYFTRSASRSISTHHPRLKELRVWG